MKYIKRLLGLPFFLALNIIAFAFNLFKLSYYWVLYGGEAVVYEKNNELKRIKDIYELLKTEHETKNITPDKNQG